MALSVPFTFPLNLISNTRINSSALNITTLSSSSSSYKAQKMALSVPFTFPLNLISNTRINSSALNITTLSSSSSSYTIFSINPRFSKPTTSIKPPRVAEQQRYVYPDPIPEFAEAETQKFRAELLKKLSNSKETFGSDCDKVVSVCAEIFSEFLHKEYGGPGTLLVEPFTDMLVALKEKKLPGAPVAARAALLWAQNYVDRDWESWTANTQT